MCTHDSTQFPSAWVPVKAMKARHQCAEGLLLVPSIHICSQITRFWYNRAKSGLIYPTADQTQRRAEHLVQPKTDLSLEAPWCCMRTQSLFISVKFTSRNSMASLMEPPSPSNSDPTSGSNPLETCRAHASSAMMIVDRAGMTLTWECDF